MTNTKFRKRALLTSVAMMLVALVALGSATFAWFTANPSVTASGLSATAATADGLKIAKTAINTAVADKPADSDYSQGVTINESNGATWAPVSPVVSGDTVTMKSGSAAAYNSYGLGTNVASNASSGQWYATDLWLKAKAASTLTVTADFGSSTAAYSRVLIVDATDAHNCVYLSNDAAATPETTTKLTSAGVEATGEGATYDSCVTGSLSTTNIASGAQFHVYIYLEGQDEDCIDANGGQTITVDLTFTKG